jgi:hypothetical protein
MDMLKEMASHTLKVCFLNFGIIILHFLLEILICICDNVSGTEA